MKDDKMNRKSFLFLAGFLYLVINHVAIYRSHPHKGADPIPMVTFVPTFFRTQANHCPYSTFTLVAPWRMGMLIRQRHIPVWTNMDRRGPAQTFTLDLVH